MKIQEMAAVACRLAALFFGLRSLGNLLMFISVMIYYGIEEEFALHHLFTTLSPFVLFMALAVLLWLGAGRLGRAAVPRHISGSVLSGVSAQEMSAAAFSVTGVIFGAISIPKIVEAVYKVYFTTDAYAFNAIQHYTGELLTGLAWLGAGLALFFGGGKLSRYLEQRNA